MTVLVGYATRYGSTKEVAEAIAETLRENGLQVDLRPVNDVRDAGSYDAAILGAALYMSKLHKEMKSFLARNKDTLENKPIAFFALGPIENEEKQWTDARTQLDKELAEYDWLKPVSVEILGGSFDPEKLRWPLNVFSRKAPKADSRNWDTIRAWARDVAEKLKLPVG